MPRRLPSPCATPGCPTLTLDRRCARHTTQQRTEYDQARGSAASRGYDARWRRLRTLVLAEQPLCADPYGLHAGRVTAATEVDHIVALRKGGTHERENLQALCKRCHTEKTNREDGGGWKSRV